MGSTTIFSFSGINEPPLGNVYHEGRVYRTAARQYDLPVSNSRITWCFSNGNITSVADFTDDFRSQGKHPVECYELGVSLDQDQIKRVLYKIDDILVAGPVAFRSKTSRVEETIARLFQAISRSGLSSTRDSLRPKRKVSTNNESGVELLKNSIGECRR
jgi:hypothetical protein